MITANVDEKKVVQTVQSVLLKPYIRAQEVYLTERCARSFKEDLEIHFMRGLVISTPEFFMLARPVRSDADHASIVNPEVRFSFPDCWHIYLMAGEWWRVFGYSPFYYPWVSFERKNILRFHSYNRILRYASYLFRKNAGLSEP